MSKNNWLSGTVSGNKQIETYINSYDFIIVERKRVVSIITKMLKYHFQSDEELKFLDLGCGDGSIMEEISLYFPNCDFYLLDGSEKMLSQAKERITNERFHYINLDFEKYIKSDDNDKYYDFVFSSMALHHLSGSEKKIMYEKIYRELRFTGLFLNFDTVKPSTNLSEKFQFEMWKDYIKEKLEESNLLEEYQKYEDLPKVYRDKPENKPSRLVENFTYLFQAGFVDVDCFYKYGIFSLFGGVK